MRIATNKVVEIDYKLTNDSGEVLDSSEGHGPLAYLHGSQNIIAGLENALEGKAAGEKLNVEIAPSEGYGEKDEDLIQPVPRDRFSGVKNLRVGMELEAHTEAGPQTVIVTSIDDENVIIDANHPLAGVTLLFDVTIVSVREATKEELEHGHAHGAGGHHHH